MKWETVTTRKSGTENNAIEKQMVGESMNVGNQGGASGQTRSGGAKNLLLQSISARLSGDEETGTRVQHQEANIMIREIRFIVTGEVKKPKIGEWFLNGKNLPICAVQDFNVTKFPLLKMEMIDEEGRAVPTYCAAL